MNDIKNILDKELKIFKQKLPKKNGNLKDISIRLKYLSTNLPKFAKHISKVVNEYISDKDLSDNEIKKIEKFCADYISKNSGSFL